MKQNVDDIALLLPAAQPSSPDRSVAFVRVCSSGNLSISVVTHASFPEDRLEKPTPDDVIDLVAEFETAATASDKVDHDEVAASAIKVMQQRAPMFKDTGIVYSVRRGIIFVTGVYDRDSGSTIIESGGTA